MSTQRRGGHLQRPTFCAARVRRPSCTPAPPLPHPTPPPPPRRSHARDSESGAEEWRVLKVDRTSAELEAAEDPTAYTRPQIQRLLATMHAGGWAGPGGSCSGGEAEWRRCSKQARLLGRPAAASFLRRRRRAQRLRPPHPSPARLQATRRTAGCRWCVRHMPSWARCGERTACTSVTHRCNAAAGRAGQAASRVCGLGASCRG